MRARRVALGLSQEAIAKKTGVTFQQVQKYEKGVNKMNLKRFIQTCAAVNILPTEAISLIVNEENIGIGKIDSKHSERSILELVKVLHLLEPYEVAAFSKLMHTLANNKKVLS